MLDLQKRSIQYNILKREVDTNRTLYEGLLQRYKEVDVASGVGSQQCFHRRQGPSAPQSLLAADVASALAFVGPRVGRWPGHGLRSRAPRRHLENLGGERTDYRPRHTGNNPEDSRAGRRSTQSSPIRDRDCRRPIARSARLCSSRPKVAYQRRCLSPAQAPRKVSRLRRWLSRGISRSWASRSCWSMRTCAIPRCTRSSVSTMRPGSATT